MRHPQTEEPANGISVHNRFVTWHILPGQLALKSDERTMSEYRSIKGLYIAPGTRALFFVNGTYVAALDSGKYPFRRFMNPHRSHTDAPTFLQALADHIADGASLLFSGSYLKKRNFYTVMLVKGADFPMQFTLDNIATNSIRSTVALDMLCSITDLETFFATQLTDGKYVTVDDFSAQLIPSVTATLNTILKDTLPGQISDNTMLISKLVPDLESCLHTIYPYVSLKHLIRLTADQVEIEALRRGNEELYIDNEKLNQLHLRNEFLNRAQSDEYTQELTSARAKVDYQKLMDKIDHDRMMNEDTRASFITQLVAERELREARTQAEVDNALDKLCQERLLSAEAVETLKRKIEFQAKEQDETNTGLLAIAVLRNQISLDKESLNWELEKENRIADNKLARNKTDFAWSQERSQKEEELRLQQEKARLEAEKDRRLTELELQQKADTQKMELQQKLDAHKMDLLRQAQALREQNLQAAHERELALRKQTADAELAKQKLSLETELEEQRLYLGMTAEQIMVANPRITPEAAMAMAKKFEAQAIVSQNAATVELMQRHNDDLKELLRDQHQLTRDVLASEMRHATETVSYKQQEIERVQTSSKEHEDRLLSGVQTATTAAASVLRTAPASNFVFCTNCGKRHPASTKVCDACNTPLQ